MPSTFFGIEIGSRALAANQLALDVTSQNLSNVNTPGYSRQVVHIDTTDPYTPPDFQHEKPGNLGTGVTVTAINRIRDEFIDKRVWNGQSAQGALSSLSDILGQVEESYNEPGDSGIGQLMTNFFNSFSDLSTNPQSAAFRSTIRNNADTMVAQIHSVNDAMNQINPQIQAKINAAVGNVNQIAQQIAGLNKQIGLSVAEGDHPNDLMDKRGELLSQLSSLVDIQVTDVQNPNTGAPTGQVQVNVGGYALVQNDTTNALPTTMTTAGNTLGLVTANGNTIPLQGGQVYGLLKATTLLSSYQGDLNTLVSNMITGFNAQHAAGYNLNGQTNVPFFTGTDAGSIQVNPAIENDANNIAAASAPIPPATYAPGNGDNARALASFTSRQVINGSSLDDFYNSSIARVGADSQSYQTQTANQAQVVNTLQNQQSSVSGVSLDEELTNMMQYQRSYQAASRIIDTMNSLLDTIINSLGAAASTAP
jgi:flagellar hook-associated protein 1 FlgK